MGNSFFLEAGCQLLLRSWCLFSSNHSRVVLSVSFLALMSLSFGCRKSKNDKKGGEPPKFSSLSTTLLISSTLEDRPAAASAFIATAETTEVPPELKCMQMTTCFTPSAFSGKILAAGLGISAKGQLESYLFGGDQYSGLSPDAGSTEYDFDLRNPTANAGTLICCNGDSSFEEEGYFQTAKFLITYADFTIMFKAPNNTKLNGEHTYRFVLANNKSLGYLRGDILLKDPSDGSFKWILGNGLLSATRTDGVAVQDSAVVNWTNPFGKGNLEIPTLESAFLGESKVVVNKNDLEQNQLSFKFDLDATNMVILNSEESALDVFNTQFELASKLHLRGLPHSKMTLGTIAFGTRELTFTKVPK